jgi:hypothetical protein|tara:strand:- start:304 stop:618 length:315 start_codon:yes stop_codon:yes gene_type:complete
MEQFKKIMVLACIFLFSLTIVVGQSERAKEEAASAKTEKETPSKVSEQVGPGEVNEAPSRDMRTPMKRPIDASTGDAKQTPSKKQGWLKKLFSRSSRKTTKEPE